MNIIYEKFYGLSQRPFTILPDPDFILWTNTHSMAFSILEYGIMTKSGITVITGDIGSGKTTLIRQLLNQLPENLTVGLISNIRKNCPDILTWVMMSLGQEFDGESYVGLFKKLQDYLIHEYFQNKRTVLIVDEAQNLDVEALEELRLLTNINADKDSLLQLILVGQPQLKDLLSRPELSQFAQRVCSDFNLRPLTHEEVKTYIAHRLSIAGAKYEIFTEEALKYVYQSSNGIPRLINIICDTSLVYGYSEGARLIDENTVLSVIKDKKEHGALSLGTEILPQLNLIKEPVSKLYK